MRKAIKTVLAVALAILLLSTETVAATIPAITEPCGMTAEELDEHLKGNLVGYAVAFLQAEEDYGINACFLASVAGLESGWGRSKVAKNKNNLFGWTKNGGGYKEFESFERCIDWCAWKIRKKYINNGLDTISKIAPIYCDEEWAEIVTEIYGGMYK